MWRIFTPERCKNMSIDNKKIGIAMDLLEKLQKGLRILEYNGEVKPAKLEEQIKDESLSIVSRWYASYDPIKYRRTMSLKHAFKTIRNGIDVMLNFDASNLTGSHHQSNEWIFQNSFIEGYHGGATGEDKAGFSVSVPTWRSPYGYYIHWGDPAPKSFSPKDEIEKMAKGYFEKYDQEWHKIIWDDVMNPIIASYNKFISAYK